MKQRIYTHIQTFFPLLSIATVILLATIITTWITEASLMRAMQYLMGYFFVVFGGFKFMNWHAFAKAYQKYDLLAARSLAYSYAYPCIEFALGIWYFFGKGLFLLSAITMVLMLFSALGVYLTLRKKEQITCACLGMVFTLPMTKVTLVEDLLMAVMAAYMLVQFI
jgi:hypothetical protein